MSTTPPPIPFSALPLDPTGPPGNAWHRFGKPDNLGTLHHLTPTTVRAAASTQIRTGIRIPLDWSLALPTHPSFRRAPFHHRLVPKRPRAEVYDDVVHFNTQCSSQWDGLRHFGYQHTGQYYGGVTGERIEADTDVLGTQHVVNAGGIVGRGVLIDYAGWAARHGKRLRHNESEAIRLEDLQAVVRESGVVLGKGDILFIRSGWTRAYEELGEEARVTLAQRPAAEFIGVEATMDVLRWLWEVQPAAVAGDMPAFEQSPLGRAPNGGGLMLHEWLIAGWGMPIGEMFDLERLAAECERQQRWTFFVSSMHLNVPGGVASPPNAVAIF